MNNIRRVLMGLFTALVLSSCANYEYPSQVSIGDTMIEVTGESLEGESVAIPQDFAGQKTLLFFGYKQDSQFDIDRWFIGLDMTQTQVAAYEIPTIQGMVPRMFSGFIDSGMRKGIPKKFWKGVVTIYADGDKIQRFTGNLNPNNARVMLLDKQGRIVYFYDQGFSVEALNEVRDAVDNEYID
jgi:cytochrome oxidase Cu insertion factor (SCO1/SenC/PrrC family)